jgi:leucyl-tRNA---protein transferase
MTVEFPIIDVVRYRTEPYSCSYLPAESASLDYRIVSNVTVGVYEELLRRGWRRFGHDFFRPACPRCSKCRSLRIDVKEFTPSQSQRRTLHKNSQIEVVVQAPSVTLDHLRLYNAYHWDMHLRRGWLRQTVTAVSYRETFVAGDKGFAREFLYFEHGRLVGVGLADLVSEALSSVYFFHDPAWRSNAPGVFSVLQQARFAREHGLRYQYLGYWIEDCQSMAYKVNYRPHEVLQSYPADHEEPIWTRHDNVS